MRLFGHEIWMKFNAWPTKRAEYSILPLFNFKRRADLQVMGFDCSLLNLNAPCHLFMHQLLIVNSCIYIPHGIRLQSSSSYSNGKVFNIPKMDATTRARLFMSNVIIVIFCNYFLIFFCKFKDKLLSTLCISHILGGLTGPKLVCCKVYPGTPYSEILQAFSSANDFLILECWSKGDGRADE